MLSVLISLLFVLFWGNIGAKVKAKNVTSSDPHSMPDRHYAIQLPDSVKSLHIPTYEYLVHTVTENGFHDTSHFSDHPNVQLPVFPIPHWPGLPQTHYCAHTRLNLYLEHHSLITTGVAFGVSKPKYPQAHIQVCFWLLTGYPTTSDLLRLPNIKCINFVCDQIDVGLGIPINPEYIRGLFCCVKSV